MTWPIRDAPALAVIGFQRLLIGSEPLSLPEMASGTRVEDPVCPDFHHILEEGDNVFPMCPILYNSLEIPRPGLCLRQLSASYHLSSIFLNCLLHCAPFRGPSH